MTDVETPTGTSSLPPSPAGRPGRIARAQRGRRSLLLGLAIAAVTLVLGLISAPVVLVGLGTGVALALMVKGAVAFMIA